MKTRFRNLWVWVGLLAAALGGQAAWAGPGGGDSRRSLAAGCATLLIVALMLVGKAATVAFNLCAAEWRPALFRKGREILVASPVKSFFVGLVNVALALIVGLALANLKVTVVFGLLLLIALLLVMYVSRTIIYQLLGTRLVGEISDPEGLPSTRAHCWGGAVIELAFLTPIIGQLAAIIVTVMTTGAMVLGWMSRERAAAVTATAASASASEKPKKG